MSKTWFNDIDIDGQRVTVEWSYCCEVIEIHQAFDAATEVDVELTDEQYETAREKLYALDPFPPYEDYEP